MKAIKRFIDEYADLIIIAIGMMILFFVSSCKANAAEKKEVYSKYYYCCAYEEGDKGSTSLMSFESPEGEECLNIEVPFSKEYIRNGDKHQGWVLEIVYYSDGSIRRAIYNPDTTDCILDDRVK